MDAEHVRLEVGDVRFYKSSEGLRKCSEDLLEFSRRKQAKDAVAERNGSLGCLEVLYLLKSDDGHAEQFVEKLIEMDVIVSRI